MASGPTVAATPGLPQGFDPGQVEKQVEEMPAATQAPHAAPLLESAKTRVTLQAQTFVLSGVLIEGATVYRSIDFLSQYRDYLGQRIALEDLSRIAEAITRKYHDDGYFLSYAFLPAQRIEFGIVRIRVIEGYISSWNLSGGRGGDALIKKILKPVMAQRPLRRATLDRAFLRLADLPDLSTHPYVRALQDPAGAYLLELNVRRRRFAGAVSVDNHGSAYIGPVEGVLVLRTFDLTGHHEAYELKLATTSQIPELHYYEFNSDWLLGTRGAILHVAGVHTDSYPGSLLKPLDTYIQNERLSVGMQYPLTHQQMTSATLGLELSNYRSRTALSGVLRLDDRINDLTLSYRCARHTDPDSTDAVTAALVQGLKVGGSEVVDTQDARGGGRPAFSKLTLDYAYVRVFRKRWQALAQVDGQYALNELPISERYSLGGAAFGRAYDPSEITGDHGLAGRMELDHLATSAGVLGHLSPYVFYDLGKVWPVNADAKAASLASAGLALRLTAADVSAYLEAAKPLTRPVASELGAGKHPRLFAGLSYSF